MRIILKHTASASTETIKSNIEIGELAIKHPVGGGASILTKDNNGDLTEFPSTVGIAALIRNEEATHGTRFGGFIDPETNFNTLDKEKFYLCSEKGQYGNGFWLFAYRIGTVTWDAVKNDWFISAKRTCKRKPRKLVNKAIRLTDFRPGDTYFFQGMVWVYAKNPVNTGFTLDGSRYRLIPGGDFNTVYSYTVPEDTSAFPSTYNTDADLKKALDIIMPSLVVKHFYDVTVKTESPFVFIENGRIIRTWVKNMKEIEFSLCMRGKADSVYDNFSENLAHLYNTIVTKNRIFLYTRRYRKTPSSNSRNEKISIKERSSEINEHRSIYTIRKYQKRRKSMFSNLRRAISPNGKNRVQSTYTIDSDVVQKYRATYIINRGDKTYYYIGWKKA